MDRENDLGVLGESGTTCSGLKLKYNFNPFDTHPGTDNEDLTCSESEQRMAAFLLLHVTIWWDKFRVSANDCRGDLLKGLRGFK